MSYLRKIKRTKQNKKSRQKSGGGWIRRLSGQRKGLSNFKNTNRKWFKPNRHFTLARGELGKTRMKFKGDKMQIVNKLPGGKKTFKTFKIDPNNPDFQALKNIKDPKKLKEELRKLSENPNSMGFQKIKSGVFGNKNLLTRRRGNLSTKTYDVTGRLKTHTSRAGKLKSKSKFKYDDNGKLLGVDTTINDSSKFGHSLGRGKSKVSHKYKVDADGKVILTGDGKPIINSTSVKTGAFGRKSKTEYMTNNTGAITGWKKKKLFKRTQITSKRNLLRHQKELKKSGITTDELSNGNVDAISQKLKSSGNFPYMSDKELKLKAKGMIKTNNKILKMKDPNAIIAAKLNKKYKKEDVKSLQASTNKARIAMENKNRKRGITPVQGTAPVQVTTPVTTQGTVPVQVTTQVTTPAQQLETAV